VVRGWLLLGLLAVAPVWIVNGSDDAVLERSPL
jgi:hypothetical protein